MTPARLTVIVLPEKIGFPETATRARRDRGCPAHYIAAESEDEHVTTVAAAAFDARLTAERQRNVEGARAAVCLA